MCLDQLCLALLLLMKVVPIHGLVIHKVPLVEGVLFSKGQSSRSLAD